MSNQVVTRKKPKWSVAITQQDYQNLIRNTLNDPARANRFIASISSVVAVNPGLQDCDAGSVLTAALLGEALNLSPSPQLGQFYMIPFENALKGPDGKKLWLYDENGEHLKDSKGKWMCQTETKAQFVIGYKGLIQLAKRSGVYRHINVIEVKAGELESYNPFTEEIKVHPILNWEKRRELPTIGYYAFFEELNGFMKAMYWSIEQMMEHADRYSPAFNVEAYHAIQRGEVAEKDMWKYSSFWYKDFDAMGKKTMLRQLISHWGSMSTEFQRAYEADGKEINAELLPEREDMPELQPEAASVSEPAALVEGQRRETVADAIRMPEKEPVMVSMDDL